MGLFDDDEDIIEEDIQPILHDFRLEHIGPDYGRFEPKVYDFGDKYHLPDEIVFAEASEEVRKIRRKYRTYNEYNAAMKTLIDYIQTLIDKYGKEEFKLRFELGILREYIPPIPRFRKTVSNKLQEKTGTVISDENYKERDYEITEEHAKRVKMSSVEWGDGLTVETSKKYSIELNEDIKNMLHAALKEYDNPSVVTSELHLMIQYSSYTDKEALKLREIESIVNPIKRAKKKDKFMKALRKKRKKEANEIIPISSNLTLYEIIKRYEEDYEEPELTARSYRGMKCTPEEYNNILVKNAFERAGLKENDYVGLEKRTIKRIKLQEKAQKEADKERKKEEKKRKKQEILEMEEGTLDLDEALGSRWGSTSFESWLEDTRTFILGEDGDDK